MPVWDQGAEVFRTMPRRSLVIFLLAVAFLFGGLGVVNDSLQLERSNETKLVITVLLSAVTAVLWALFGSLKMKRAMLALAIGQAALFSVTGRWAPAPTRVLTRAQWQTEVLLHGLIEIACIVAAYLAFLAFFRFEGRRFFAAHTEIRLAAGIQKNLVPTVEERVGDWEFYGRSVPSGAVGGDLLDVIRSDGAACAYVADVAGHGVPAGVLMSMVKAAVRMRVAEGGARNGSLLGSLNEVLTPLTDSRSYATFAYVNVCSERELVFSLAGHLPILHYRNATGEVEQRSVENLPVAMFPGVQFATAKLEWGAGDVLAIVTDGLTELADGKGKEIGMEYITTAMAEGATGPLREIAETVFAKSEAFGKAEDDRTLLLMRSLRGPDAPGPRD